MPQSHQLAAIMFTDIVGYTALMGIDEQKAFDLLRKNRELQKPIIENYNGRWIKELGDGVLASFNSVSDAVTAAIKIQDACNAAKNFQLRIGIHLGEVAFENDDVFGDGVNIASRIQVIADPGAIFISESVHHNVSNKQGIETKFVKQETLKNVKEPVRIYRVLIEESNPDKANGYNINSAPENSIAVLPFVNMSNDPDQEYFCDGITEEMINTLTMSGSLRVIARTSAFAFKNKFTDIQEIGRKLQVEYILEGSIRKAADKIRLNAKLISVANGDHLWAGKFDRDLTDIFSIQEEIAVSIATQLKILMQERHLKPPTHNMEAFNYYLQGRHIAGKGEYDWERKSIEFYEKAISKDPKYASAHAAIALSLWYMTLEGQHEFSDKISKHAGLAIQFDNTNAEAHAAMALSKYYNNWKWDEAENEFIKAIQLNPYSVLALHHFATLLSNLNRGEEALTILNRALHIDPLNTMLNQTLGWCYFTVGKYQLSKTQSQETLRIEPTNFLAKIVLCFSLIELREFSETKSVLATLPHDNLFARTCEVWLYATANDLSKAKKIIDEVSDKREEFPSLIAWMKIAVQEYDEAFEWLNLSLEKRETMIMSLPVFKWWDPIRNDPRFENILKKTGLAEYLKTYSPLPFQTT